MPYNVILDESARCDSGIEHKFMGIVLAFVTKFSCTVLLGICSVPMI